MQVKLLMNLSSMKRLYMNTLTQLILDALLVTILFWNGIDFYAEFMEEVVDLTISTRQILKKVFINNRNKLKEG